MRAPDFWAEDGLWPRLLAPVAAVVAGAGRLRRAMARPVAVGVPVVCVGNLVAGGAGKTPLVLSLLAALNARGMAAHALSRGYGGRHRGPLGVDPRVHGVADVGDEALLLARAAPTWVARDRPAGARAALAAGAAVIVMDDGFQNPSIRKDLSVLAVDGGAGFGNGRVMPAGPLREPLRRGLARADAVVLIGVDERDVARQLNSGPPLYRAELVPAAGSERLAGRRVLAFAGIGRPAKLFASLKNLGAELVETRAFPDHHPYRPAEVEAMIARARALDALPVTTEKDAVRLPSDQREKVEALAVTLSWQDPESVTRLLESILGPRR